MFLWVFINIITYPRRGNREATRGKEGRRRENCGRIIQIHRWFQYLSVPFSRSWNCLCWSSHESEGKSERDPIASKGISRIETMGKGESRSSQCECLVLIRCVFLSSPFFSSFSTTQSTRTTQRFTRRNWRCLRAKTTTTRYFPFRSSDWSLIFPPLPQIDLWSFFLLRSRSISSSRSLSISMAISFNASSSRPWSSFSFQDSSQDPRVSTVTLQSIYHIGPFQWMVSNRSSESSAHHVDKRSITKGSDWSREDRPSSYPSSSNSWSLSKEDNRYFPSSIRWLFFSISLNLSLLLHSHSFWSWPLSGEEEKGKKRKNGKEWHTIPFRFLCGSV